MDEWVVDGHLLTRDEPANHAALHLMPTRRQLNTFHLACVEVHPRRSSCATALAIGGNSHRLVIYVDPFFIICDVDQH